MANFPPLFGFQQKILFKLQSQAEHNTANVQTAPEYSSATATMLVIFWTESDFYIVFDCKNLFNNKPKNL